MACVTTASSAVGAPTVAGAPTNILATPYGTQAIMAFTPPESDGGGITACRHEPGAWRYLHMLGRDT
jgi:hypothetical protein